MPDAARVRAPEPSELEYEIDETVIRRVIRARRVTPGGATGFAVELTQPSPLTRAVSALAGKVGR